MIERVGTVGAWRLYGNGVRQKRGARAREFAGLKTNSRSGTENCRDGRGRCRASTVDSRVRDEGGAGPRPHTQRGNGGEGCCGGLLEVTGSRHGCLWVVGAPVDLHQRKREEVTSTGVSVQPLRWDSPTLNSDLIVRFRHRESSYVEYSKTHMIDSTRLITPVGRTCQSTGRIHEWFPDHSAGTSSLASMSGSMSRGSTARSSWPRTNSGIVFRS